MSTISHSYLTAPTNYRSSVKSAIDEYAKAYASDTMDTVTGYQVDTIMFGLLSGDLQVRDYFLGLPLDYDLETATNIVSNLSASLPTGNKRHLYCALAMFAFEKGDTKGALDLLDICDSEADYSLSSLLRRAIQAGWESDAFVAMRNSCHAGVTEAMSEDEPIHFTN